MPHSLRVTLIVVLVGFGVLHTVLPLDAKAEVDNSEALRILNTVPNGLPYEYIRIESLVVGLPSPYRRTEDQDTKNYSLSMANEILNLAMEFNSPENYNFGKFREKHKHHPYGMFRQPSASAIDVHRLLNLHGVISGYQLKYLGLSIYSVAPIINSAFESTCNVKANDGLEVYYCDVKISGSQVDVIGVSEGSSQIEILFDVSSAGVIEPFGEFIERSRDIVYEGGRDIFGTIPDRTLFDILIKSYIFESGGAFKEGRNRVSFTKFGDKWDMD